VVSFAACAQPQGAAVRRSGRCSWESQSLLRHRRLCNRAFPFKDDFKGPSVAADTTGGPSFIFS